MDGKWFADTVWQKLQDYDASRPRSVQEHLGPSEIADECEKEIAWKVSGAHAGPKRRNPWAWEAIQGTAIHAHIEQALAKDPHWLTEKSLSMGSVTRGTSDAYHIPSGTVVDWKTAGKTVLAEVRKGGLGYKRMGQGSCYGMGWEDAGFEVRQVCMVFLPRGLSIEDRVGICEPYDRAFAQEVLDRYLRIVQAVKELDLSNHPERLTEFAPRSKGCHYCSHPQGVQKTSGPTEDLLS